jgi:hypothetical protein
MKLKTFKIKATLRFPDGQLSGTLKVKASTKEKAEQMARVQLASTWGDIYLIEIKIN